jgi:hypothetical protein
MHSTLEYSDMFVQGRGTTGGDLVSNLQPSKTRSEPVHLLFLPSGTGVDGVQQVI